MNEHLGAVAAVRERIAARSRDSRLLLAEKVMPGLADDLRAIGEAFASLDVSCKLLARVILSKHYGYNLSTPEYQALATLAGEVSLTHFAERG